MAKWIKKLDDALLKEGVSPAVAFKSADSNRDGSISLDELRETIKRLIPEEELSYLEVLKIVKAFDTDKNKVISE
jgi:Ca2+-binding EF-hand superfamily protein